MSNRHHHTPQFFLREFQSAPRRIHVFNLARRLPIRDASLRDQCYRHRFYGETDDLEKMLSQMESLIAPVLQRINRSRTLPSPGTLEYGLVMLFIALQLQRTPTAAERVNESTDRLTKQVFGRDPDLREVDLDSVRIGYTDPVLISLAAFPEIIRAIDDLRAHLVCATGGQRFITGDSPVFKYNKYCEGVRSMGITGAASRGLHLFVPLSPTLLLLLYDGAVYKAGNRGSSITPSISDADVEALNLLQAVGAHENLLFSEWQQVEDVKKAAARAVRFRDRNAMRVEEFVQEDDPHRHSLICLFERTPNLELDLSFLRPRRDARRVPMLDRIHKFRKILPEPDLEEGAPVEGRSVLFVRPPNDR